MKKVFLVTSGEYSDYGIRAAFSTRDKAQKFIGAFKPAPFHNMEVEEWDLDTDSIDDEHKAYFLRISRDGTVSDLKQSDSPYGFGGDGQMGYDINGDLYMHIFARDEQHAIKIAGERRAHIIATRKWGELPTAA